MTLRNALASAALAACLAYGVQNAQAAALTPGAGWVDDQINAANAPSTGSAWTFTLTGPGAFRITDQFVSGDIFKLFDGATLLGTSSFNGPQVSLTPIGDAAGDAGWTSEIYSHLSVALAAGSYSLTVTGDCVGGVPAGFYVRVDTTEVPEPAAMAMFGLGLLGLAAVRRRAKAG